MSIDHSSHREFLEYYATESQSQRTRDRFSALRDIVLRVVKNRRGNVPMLEVLDVGCGAGALSLLWADAGHRVHGLDVNEPLLSLARERAER